MLKGIIRVFFGYGLSVLVATCAAVMMLALETGTWSLGWHDIAAGAFIIGLTAWGGLLFAIRGEMAGWTRASTYAGGGLLAMVVGVATITALGILQGLVQGYAEWDTKHAMSLLHNAAQLLALGIIPGIAGGLTYWLAAVLKDRKRPV
jgi:hypothetical protein